MKLSMTATSRAARLSAGIALLSGFAAALPAQHAPPPRSLSLDEALALATGTSEGVGLARAGVTRSRGQQTQAASALLPQVNTALNYQKQLQNQFQAITERFGGGGGNNGGDGDLADNPITRIFASPYTVTYALQASQPVFTGGRARAGLAAARFSRSVSELGVTSATAQAQLEVTQAYYDAVLTERLVAIAESSLVQSERTLRQVQLTFDVGNTSEFELIRARVTRDNQRPQYLQSRTQRDLALLRLKQLLDLPLEQPLTLTSTIQETPIEGSTSVPAAGATSLVVSREEVLAPDPRVREAMQAVVASMDTTLGTRVPVRQAALGVDVAQQQLKAARGQRLPQLSINTNYQRFAYPDDGLPNSLADFFPNWTVGFGVSLPLFSGGRVRGEILAAEAGVEEARLRLQQAREGAELDRLQSLLRLEEAQAAWLASVGTAAQAQRGYEIAEVRYREGLSTQLELSETRVQLQQALANRALAARDLQVARIRITLLQQLPLAGVVGSPPPAGQAPVSTIRSSQSAGPVGAFTQPGAPGGGTTP
jgi:outer membrane protein